MRFDVRTEPYPVGIECIVTTISGVPGVISIGDIFVVGPGLIRIGERFVDEFGVPGFSKHVCQEIAINHSMAQGRAACYPLPWMVPYNRPVDGEESEKWYSEHPEKVDA